MPKEIKGNETKGTALCLQVVHSFHDADFGTLSAKIHTYTERSSQSQRENDVSEFCLPSILATVKASTLRLVSKTAINDEQKTLIYSDLILQILWHLKASSSTKDS
ncbi:hypothetical protein F0562_035962 [Nyssa sinensis]|uniref:Uncharacterized protein n=1 Tax=Nyssa sinensis TaxID=561372 RepID=A0A5J5AGM2_9ASTE|nr:hypothetical protein F0562_035962 [Nyssa sinensis]